MMRRRIRVREQPDHEINREQLAHALLAAARAVVAERTSGGEEEPDHREH